LDYSVREDEHPAIDDYPCGGYISEEQRTIVIESGTSPFQQEEAFLHEVFHGVSSALGFKFSEHIVQSMSRGLTAAGVRVLVKGKPLFEVG
jgi:hypothetical protein